MMQILIFTVLGYLSGSILFARIWSKVFHKNDMIEKSADKNPGVANAFQYGGFWCGCLTLVCDLLKGILPVHFYIEYASGVMENGIGLALVLAAPVVGHVFSVFHHFQGGKGITVTFGVLAGLYPFAMPFWIMVVSFLFFSLIIRITPHFYRTIVAYVCAWMGIVLCCIREVIPVCIGFTIISGAVLIRMHKSTEQVEKMKVGLLWKY